MNSNCHRELCEFLQQQIEASPQKRITFAQYMDWVLYHPLYGYYASHHPKIGASGDFFTAVHLGSDFGELLAEQFVQMWEILEHPQPFTLVEMGAGQGLLAADILSFLQKKYPDFFQVLDYIIIEKSYQFQTEQRFQLQNRINSEYQVQWCNWDSIPLNSITGCCFSNELVDAFPVHQVVFEGEQLQEVYVTNTSDQSSNSGGFEEIIAPLSTPELSTYFQTLGFDFSSNRYPEPYRTEVNLEAIKWIETVASKLHRGFLLTIDYGYSTEKYYSPTRQAGSLQCYFQHRYHNNPYINIGHQDLTAHINFTALEYWCKQAGLEPVGFTQQALFLMALGLSDRLNTLYQTDNLPLKEVLQCREALHRLINPMGLGNFGVLVQSKGLQEYQPIQLKGLIVPELG
ncbi:MAG: class I SAM-dependent methyltransferase [Microcoleaceae cyanobacterium]